MPLKDRFRKAIGRTSPDSTRSSSISSTFSLSPPSTLSPTPTIPTIALTKTSSRLSQITSFRSLRSRKDKTTEPKNAKHQEMLKSFEWKFGRAGRPSIDGGRSCFSGISPMASRNGSVDEGALQSVVESARRRSGASVAAGGPSRQASRVEAHDDVEKIEEE